MFKINALHEDGRVKATFTLDGLEKDLGYIYATSCTGKRFVDFLDNLCNRRPMLCDWTYYEWFEQHDAKTYSCGNFESDAEYLYINTNTNSDDDYFPIKIPLTNEVFTEMEKLVITTHGKYSKHYEPTVKGDICVDDFPYDYVYGRSISETIPPIPQRYEPGFLPTQYTTKDECCCRPCICGCLH